MNILSDLSTSLIATLLGILIGAGYRFFKQFIQLKYTKYFWKPFVKGKRTLFIIGRIQELEWEKSGLIGFGDAVALAELKSYFDSLKIKNVDIKYDKDVDGDDLKSNLVLLGGPQTNIITQKVLSEVHSTLKFDDSGFSVGITDTKENVRYNSSESSSGDIDVDFGLIIRSRSPFDYSKKVVVIAGSWGYGTWAGVRLSLSKSFLEEKPEVLSFDSFESLFKSDIVLKTPQNMKAIILRQIQV